jgi:hypothetical protein
MTSPSATQDTYPYQKEPDWSKSEKAIARRAFDAALGRELRLSQDKSSSQLAAGKKVSSASNQQMFVFVVALSEKWTR